MAHEEKPLRSDIEALTLEWVRYLIDQIKSVIPHLDDLANVSDEIRTQIQKQPAS